MAKKTIPRIRTLLLLAVSAIAFQSLANAGSYLYSVIDDGLVSGTKVTFSFDETTLASSGTVTSGFFNVTGRPVFALLGIRNRQRAVADFASVSATQVAAVRD